MSIDEFYEKYQTKENENDFKFDFTADHYYVKNDWSLNFKELHLDKYNIDEFKQLIEDYDNNRKNWEKNEICQDCERRKRNKEFCKE
ncbi:hypothetical protein SKUN_001705 [Spiroplasma kunkelii CR2-3x]|uniref:Uncharacterized protein n=1 Tax=Spiroplasma kunkelii CR2-3x TaxID=273035 RepID=A0A0K2JJX2_SPIKU|nr:hypothetical protein [Spiroplasma kunkelii]ALA98561.1 hypothetical protein SKUN_001705 [Spiroplasma kunkelii CR2-3x]